MKTFFAATANTNRIRRDLLALVKGRFEGFRAEHDSRLPDLEIIEEVVTVEAPQCWVRGPPEEMSAVPQLQFLSQPAFALQSDAE